MRTLFRKFRHDAEVASRRCPVQAVEPTSVRFSLSRYAELLRPWNVRDKLHEHMPYGVTENGRAHLFSFSGHVTTASSRHICIMRYLIFTLLYGIFIPLMVVAYDIIPCLPNDTLNESSVFGFPFKKYFVCESALYFVFQYIHLLIQSFTKITFDKRNWIMSHLMRNIITNINSKDLDFQTILI